MNDILIDQIVELNIEDINLTDPTGHQKYQHYRLFPCMTILTGRSAIFGNTSLAKFDCLDNTIYNWLEEAENTTLLSGTEHCHARFYFDEHDILVLSALGALVRNEKPIFVDNF
jgi:hypothetical protein